MLVQHRKRPSHFVDSAHWPVPCSSCISSSQASISDDFSVAAFRSPKRLSDLGDSLRRVDLIPILLRVSLYVPYELVAQPAYRDRVGVSQHGNFGRRQHRPLRGFWQDSFTGAFDGPRLLDPGDRIRPTLGSPPKALPDQFPLYPDPRRPEIAARNSFIDPGYCLRPFCHPFAPVSQPYHIRLAAGDLRPRYQRGATKRR